MTWWKMTGRIFIICFYLLVLIFSFGCATTNTIQAISPQKFYSNSKGFELSAIDKTLIIAYSKDKNPSYKRVEYGIYNPAVGVMAVYAVINDRFFDKTDVTFYKIVNAPMIELLDEIIANPQHYPANKLSEIFIGNLPYITYDGKYKGNDIVQRIENYNNELSAFQKANISLVGFRGHGVFEFRGNGQRFIENYSKLTDIFGFVGATKSSAIYGANKNIKVNFKPTIVNNTGFSKANIKSMAQHKVTKEYESGKYRVDISKTNTRNFVYDISPDNYLLDYSDNEIDVAPQITVHKMHVNRFAPNISVSNNDIEIVITKLNAFNESRPMIEFDFNIKNKSNKYIKVDAISFYVNKGIFTWEKQYSLPPMAEVTNERISTKDIADKNRVSNEAGSLDKYISADEAKKYMLTIGVSLNYKIEGKERNLFKINDINFYDMI